MSNRFSVIATSNQKDKNKLHLLKDSLDNRIKSVIGRALDNAKITQELNTTYAYNNTLQIILFRIVSILLDDFGLEGTFKYKIVENTQLFEPIFAVTGKVSLILVFDQSLIAEYYNNSDFGITARKIDAKGSRCVQFDSNALLNLTPSSYKPNSDGPPIPSDVMDKLIKLYVLAEHAVEHLHYHHTKNTFDMNHEYFNKNPLFLSHIITLEPDKNIHKQLYSSSAPPNKKKHKLFSLYKTTECDSSDDDDESSTSDESSSEVENQKFCTQSDTE